MDREKSKDSRSEKSRYFPDEFQWVELPEQCRRCRLPLHMREDQEFPFCPNCVADKINATRGREALLITLERYEKQTGVSVSHDPAFQEMKETLQIVDGLIHTPTHCFHRMQGSPVHERIHHALARTEENPS